MNPFTLLLILGVAVGLYNLYRRAEYARLNRAVFLCLGLGLIAARLVFITIRWPYYHINLWEIFQFSAGGLDGCGAFGGVLLGIWLSAAGLKQRFYQLLTRLAAVYMPVLIAIWLACWLEGIAYGPPITVKELSWLDWQTPDNPHWPLPLLAALFLWAYLIWMDRHFMNTISMKASIFYGLGVIATLVFVTLLRLDEPAPLWLGIRLDLIGTAGLVIGLGLSWLIDWKLLKGKRYES